MIDIIINACLLIILTSFTLRSIFKTFRIISEFFEYKRESNFKRFTK